MFRLNCKTIQQFKSMENRLMIEYIVQQVGSNFVLNRSMINYHINNRSLIEEIHMDYS